MYHAVIGLTRHVSGRKMLRSRARIQLSVHTDKTVSVYLSFPISRNSVTRNMRLYFQAILTCALASYVLVSGENTDSELLSPRIVQCLANGEVSKGSPLVIKYPFKKFSACEYILWNITNKDATGTTIRGMFTELTLIKENFITLENDEHSWIITAATPDRSNYLIAGESIKMELVNPLLTNGTSFNLQLDVQDSGKDFYQQPSGSIDFEPKTATSTSWTITAPSNTQQVVVSLLNTTNLTGTSELWFYDGHSTKNEIFHLKTGDTLITMFSKSSKMLISAKNFTGKFHATFVASPSGTHSMSTGDADFLRMTGPFKANQIRRWLIKPPTQTIALTLDYANVYPTSRVNVFVNTVRFLSVTQSFSTPRVLFIDLPHTGSYVHVEYTSTENISATDPLVSGSYTLRGSECLTDSLVAKPSKGTHIISSPGYPTTYPFYVNCQKNIALKDESLFHISFKEFDLNEKHYLNFSVNENGKMKGLLSYKEKYSTLPQDVVLRGTEIAFNFSTFELSKFSDPPPKGFQLSVNVMQCGDFFSKTSGSFNLSANETLPCLWRIDTTSDTISNTQFTVKSSDQKHNGSNFEFYDGPHMATAVKLPFSMVNGVGVVLSRTSQVFVRSYPSGESPSYTISYATKACNQLCDNGQVCLEESYKCNGINECGDYSDEKYCYFMKGCGDNSTLTVNGNLRHKFTYPDGVDVPVTCSWTVQSSKDHSLLANFVDIQLSYPDEIAIVNDETFDVPNAMATKFNVDEMKKLQIVSAKSELKVNVTLRSSKASVTLDFTEQSTGAPAGCSAPCTLKISEIDENATSTVLLVKAPRNQQVQVAVNSTLLPEAKLKFYDGVTFDTLLATFTTFHLDSPYPVFSVQDTMMIVAEGFHGSSSAIITAKPLPRGSKQFSSDNVGYLLSDLPEQGLTWVIKPKENKSSEDSIIELKLKTLLRGGVITVKLSQDKFDDIVKFETPFTSTQIVHIPVNKGAIVTITTNDSGPEERILDASYEVIPAPIVHKVFNESGVSINITSPGYPNLYPLNAKSLWTFETEKMPLLFTFMEMSLAETDTLTITQTVDNSTSAFLFRGKTLPDDFVVSGATSVQVEFSSERKSASDTTVEKGFKLNVKAIDCGGTYKQGKNHFETPDKVGKYECVWVVLPTDIKKSNKPEYIEAHLKDYMAVSNLLKIYDGGKLSSPTINISDTVFSHFDKLLFHYKQDSKAKGVKAVVVDYESMECEETCHNEMCMQPSWKCNSINDCGDGSDEIGCSLSSGGGGVSKGWLAGGIILALAFGIILVLGVQFLLRKRAQKSDGNYQSFGKTEE